MPIHPADTFVAPVRALVGLVVTSLPRRIWNDWEGRVPVRAMALPAALIVFLSGFALGIPGFLRYSARMGSAVGDLVLEAGARVNEGRMPPEAGVYAWYTTVLALPAFALFTPLGLLCTYFVASGLVRVACCLADDPRGDPLLTAADTLVRRWRDGARTRRAEETRRALEGAEVPDLLLRGPAAGLPDAVFVLVASRLKPGWDKGVLLLTEEGRFRVGECCDREFPEGLRALYPLHEVAALEVTRRALPCTLPPLSEVDPDPGRS